MVQEPFPVFVVGASGHGKVIIDIILSSGGSVPFLIDDDPRKHGTDMCGVPVRGGRDYLFSGEVSASELAAIIAIGDNGIRSRVAGWLEETNFSMATVVHPNASVSAFTHVGPGTVVMAGAVVNPATTVGKNVILNTRCSIDHDCTIGDFVHVAPGATLCGGVRVGDGTFVGAGAIIIPNITVGRNSVVGAGATVVSDVPDGVLVVGTPAKTVRNTTSVR